MRLFRSIDVVILPKSLLPKFRSFINSFLIDNIHVNSTYKEVIKSILLNIKIL